MTTLTSSAGGLLLRLARVVFDEAVVHDVVEPTVRDLRQELHDAGRDHRKRIMARWRGYRAFWALVFVAPVAFGIWDARRRRPAATFPDIADRIGSWSILLAVAVFAWTFAREWVLVPIAGAGLVAIVVHRWYTRHPLTRPSRESTRQNRQPEINLARIHVGADTGGLMFVVGAVVACLAGLPALRWFLLTTIVGGGALAWAIGRWHLRHAQGLTPENSIACR